MVKPVRESVLPWLDAVGVQEVVLVRHRRHVRLLGGLRLGPPFPLFPVLTPLRAVPPIDVPARRRPPLSWDRSALQECQGHPRVDPANVTPYQQGKV